MKREKDRGLADNYRSPVKIWVTVLLMLFAGSAFSQTGIYQDINAYGYRWQRGVFRYNLGVPNDTFPIPSTQVLQAHFAIKDGIPYYWSVSAQKWQRVVSASTTSTTQQMVSEFSVIDDKGRYDFLPNPVVNEDTLLIFSKNSNSHTTDGNATVYQSKDGGVTWDSLAVAASTQIGALSAGRFARDHIVYSYTKETTGGTKIYHSYSLNGGRTWTLSDSTLWTNAYPHGEIIKLPGGRMVHTVWRSSNNSVYTVYSDDGITWDSLGLIWGGPTSYNETSIEVVSGTTNANAVLVAVARQETASIHSGQFYSTDGGATWTYAGSLTFGYEGARAPTFLKVYRGYLYAIKGVRREYETSGQYNFITYRKAPLAVYNDTTLWDRRIPKIYQSSGAPYKTTAFNHFGYAMPFVYAGKLMLTAYDLSPRTLRPGSLNPTEFFTRMFVMPVLRSPYFAGWGYGNQPIPTGTATKVAFQTIFYDTEGYASETDSGYLVKRDGDYSISATVTIAGDTTGTYRRLYIALDDAGMVDTSGTLDVIVQDRTISGTSSQDFNKVTLSGTVFAKAGTYIRVYAIHDATTSLDIINSLAAYRARLIVKQIQ